MGESVSVKNSQDSSSDDYYNKPNWEFSLPAPAELGTVTVEDKNVATKDSSGNWKANSHEVSTSKSGTYNNKINVTITAPKN
jgi:hypothetical protein